MLLLRQLTRWRSFCFVEYHVKDFAVDPAGLGVIILASGSEVRGFDPGRGPWIFSERKNPGYDLLRKGSKAVGPVSSIYRHVKEPQAEIRASDQNLSAFSSSMSEAMLMT